MMLLETIINLVAPHVCLVCNREGTLLCQGCQTERQPQVVRRGRSVDHIWVCSAYDGLSKQLLQRLKFERTPAAAEHIAKALASRGPTGDYLLVPVRTSLSRARQRGYDQAVLITRHLAHMVSQPLADVLIHAGNTRQLGAKRQERLRQLRGVYRVSHPERIKGRHVILIDDVMTTGATLEAAASALLGAGAKSVDGLVFAAA